MRSLLFGVIIGRQSRYDWDKLKGGFKDKLHQQRWKPRMKNCLSFTCKTFWLAWKWEKINVSCVATSKESRMSAGTNWEPIGNLKNFKNSLFLCFFFLHRRNFLNFSTVWFFFCCNSSKISSRDIYQNYVCFSVNFMCFLPQFLIAPFRFCAILVAMAPQPLKAFQHLSLGSGLTHLCRCDSFCVLLLRGSCRGPGRPL